MKKRKGKTLPLRSLVGLLALSLIPTSVGAQEPVKTSTDFQYTGNVQTWTAPQSGTYRLETWGAQGGGALNCGNPSQGLSGLGGYAQGEVNLNAGETLYIYVGGEGGCSSNGLAPGGWNGGGSGYASYESEPGGGGGGATDIRRTSGSWDDYTGLHSRLIVAGGGGGGGEDGHYTDTENYSDPYGDGGGLEGSNGFFAGTQTSPGQGGGFGYGGSTGYGDGGGGGGGWYGGGTPSSTSIGSDTDGGGGGSAYIGGVSNGTMQTAVKNGHGMARITLLGQQTADLIKITVNERSVSLPVGSGTPLVVTAHYSDGSTRDITYQATYKSSNSNVLAVNVDGYVSAAGRGTADISIIFKEKISTGTTKMVSARIKGTVY